MSAAKVTSAVSVTPTPSERPSSARKVFFSEVMPFDRRIWIFRKEESAGFWQGIELWFEHAFGLGPSNQCFDDHPELQTDGGESDGNQQSISLSDVAAFSENIQAHGDAGKDQ